MPKKYDVVAITGTYQKEGQDKAKFTNVGIITEKEGKFYLKLNTAVVFHDDGHVVQWFNLYEPKPKQAPQQAAPAAPDFDDYLPNW